MMTNKKLYIPLVVIAIAFISFFVYQKLNSSKQPSNAKHADHQVEKKIYTCPMHPHYTSDKPGDCPICGMKLIDKTPSKKHKHHEDTKVDIDLNKQQLIGISTTQANKRSIDKRIKALGLVTADERLINHVHTRFSGYVDRVYANYEGKYISKGDRLFTIYSPELVSTQEEYLLALKASANKKTTGFDIIDQSQKALLEASTRRLKLWNISEKEIDELKNTETVKKNLTIFSNYSGFITKKNITDGLTVDPSKTLYEITDLSRVWVIAEVYEDDIQNIELNQKVTVKQPYNDSEILQGTLTYIYPNLDPVNRTAKVRVEVNNRNYKFKPNMYVDVYIAQNLGEKISVPKSSIIDTGERSIVFVKSGEGSFKPTEVILGSEFDVNNERYQVIQSGISEEDIVVTDGNFLLDSESNLQAALKQMTGGHQH